VKAVLNQEIAVETMQAQAEQVTPVEDAVASVVDAALEAEVAPATAVEAISTNAKVQTKPRTSFERFLDGSDEGESKDAARKATVHATMHRVDFSHLDALFPHRVESRAEAAAILHDPLHRAIKAKHQQIARDRETRIASGGGGEALESLVRIGPPSRDDDEADTS